eukprot:scaffold2.g7147.t1
MTQAAATSPILPLVQAHWSSLDLEGLRSKLDEQGLGIAERQDATRQSRATLAERTKEFRRAASADVVKQVTPLLKAYQEEVDRLTGRAKQGESAFLDLYRVLYAAPDPAPALTAGLEAASRAAELEAQVTKLAQELAEYKAESSQLRNQDLTIRRLQEQERQLEEQEQSAAAVERERMEAERLHHTTQNQLFSIQTKTEEEAAGMQSELEFATAEMERAQQRLAMLEREKEALLQKVQAAVQAQEASEAAPERRDAEESLRQELQAQWELAGRLQIEVASLRQQVESGAATWSARVEGLRSTLEAREAHCAALDAELAARPTQLELDELRAQVRILQAVGYNMLDGEEDAGGEGEGAAAGGPADAGAAAGERQAARSLEAALLAKAKHLEHQLTMAKLGLAEARGEAEASAAKVEELEGELRQHKELVARLEEDLATAEAATVDAAAGPRQGSGALDEGGAGDATGGEQTMLMVLTGQRDRFRNRVRELEESVAMLTQDLSRVRGEAAAVRADNLALVERLKFVQGYAGSSGSLRRQAAADLEAGAVVRKYSEEYEASVNPFADFRAREREARRKQLPLQDKAMLGLTTVITSSRGARTAVFCYALLLHFVIFLVLARSSHHHISKLEEAEEVSERACER